MIRDLKLKDGPRVFEFLKNYFPEEERYLGTRPEGVERVLRRVFRWDIRFLLGMARLFGRPAFRFFVVEEDGKIVATTLLSFPERAGYVSTVSVDASYRRRGLARSLLERARVATLATGRKYIALEVLADNTPARALYESIGYRPLRESHLLVRENGGPAPVAASPAIRPFRREDARAVVAIANRLQPSEVHEVLPVRESAVRGSGFIERVLETETAAWVVDRGHGPEGYLSASTSRLTEAGNLSDPILAETVPAADAAALVSGAVAWSQAHGSKRVVTNVPVANVRGRAALLEGGFHEAIVLWTLYRTAA